MHKFRNNKLLRISLLTLSAFFILEGADLLFNNEQVSGQEQIKKDSLSVYPENYFQDFYMGDFRLDYYTACFKGKNGRTHMEIYYSIPLNYFLFNPDISKKDDQEVSKIKFVTNIKEKFSIFDYAHNSEKIYTNIYKAYVDDYYPGRMNEKNSPGRMDWTYLFRQKILEIQPGKYMFTIQVEDEFSITTGIIKKAISVESFKSDSLKLSDFVLGVTIDTVLSRSEFNPRGFANMPNPALSYLIDQPLYLYYEIYNLRLGPPGVTNYTVDYKINRDKNEGRSVVKLYSGIRRLLGIEEKQEEISTSYKYSGIYPEEKQYLIINMEGNEPGFYHLTLSVTDLNSHQKVSKHRIVNFTHKVGHYLFPK